MAPSSNDIWQKELLNIRMKPGTPSLVGCDIAFSGQQNNGMNSIRIQSYSYSSPLVRDLTVDFPLCDACQNLSGVDIGNVSHIPRGWVCTIARCVSRWRRHTRTCVGWTCIPPGLASFVSGSQSLQSRIRVCVAFGTTILRSDLAPGLPTTFLQANENLGRVLHYWSCNHSGSSARRSASCSNDFTAVLLKEDAGRQMFREASRFLRNHGRR